MFASILTTIFFSISILCAARSAKILGGVSANFLRLLIATVVLGLWAHSFGEGFKGLGFWTFFISGCIGYGLGDFALFESLPRIGARLSCLLAQCLAAPFAAFIEWMWLGTTLTFMQMFFATLILGGVSLALIPNDHLETSKRDQWIGILFGIVAAFGQGFGAVLSRNAFGLEERGGESIDGMTAAYQRILGGLLVSFVLFMVLHKRFKFLKEKERNNQKRLSAWPWVVSNALTGPAIGVSCYQWTLKTIPTGIVLPIVAITPLIIIPMAHWTEGEKISRKSLVGAILAILGVILLVIKF